MLNDLVSISQQKLEFGVPNVATNQAARVNPIPELKVEIPGIEKTVSELSKLNQTFSQLPQLCREELLRSVSSMEDRWQAHRVSHNVGFVNGAVLMLILGIIWHLFFSRTRAK